MMLSEPNILKHLADHSLVCLNLLAERAREICLIVFGFAKQAQANIWYFLIADISDREAV